MTPADAPTYITAETVARWDAVTSDVRGEPETIARYELSFSPVAVDLRTAAPAQAPVVLQARDPVAGVLIAPLFAGAPPGVYNLYVRAVDAAGLISAWSAPIVVGWDTNAPRPPTGLRIEIRITVGG